MPVSSKAEDNRKVTVCASCLRASCWHYDFICNDHRTAGIVEKTVGELRKLKLEHSSYWAEGFGEE